jgi:signal peptidase I
MKATGKQKKGLIISGLIWTLLVVWTNTWPLLLLNLLIYDAWISKLIPWKKLASWIPQPVRTFLEWTGYVLIALLISVLTKVLFVEAYKIPTPSMEGSLLSGDYIFVSKLAYGPKLPNTPISWPFVANQLHSGKKTYSDKIQLRYKRLLGISKVKRNDVIVFSFPEGDSMIVQYPAQNYYSLVRQYGRPYIHEHFDMITHPVDRRENYIKRCIALPGDTISIRQGKTFVNSELIDFHKLYKFKYYLRTHGEKLPDEILDSLKILKNEITYNPANSLHVIFMTMEQASQIHAFPEVRSVQRFTEPILSFHNPEIYPHHHSFNWTNDLFGPVVVPKKGMTISLTPENIALYGRAIRVYENNTLSYQNHNYYLNHIETDNYTFQMDYYFVLGDNRHKSADSRHWGFVPEDHLLGKAVAIWYSSDPQKSFVEGLRKERIFKRIN